MLGDCDELAVRLFFFKRRFPATPPESPLERILLLLPGDGVPSLDEVPLRWKNEEILNWNGRNKNLNNFIDVSFLFISLYHDFY
jgi:uncharacterized membrane protein YjdF